MNSDVFVGRLLSRIAMLEKIVNRQEARLNNMFREAKVSELKEEDGLAIVDAHGVESKEVPWMEPAGEISEWTPVSAGQRVMLVSPGGNVGRSFIIPGGFTDDNPAPHNKGGEKRIKIGEAQVTYSAGGMLFEVGGCSVNITSSGVTTTVGGVTYAITGAGSSQTGGQQLHDDKDVGKTSTHTGVTVGGGTTGPVA